jgi:tetratricopeptide (TPR) repeat protein
MTFLSSSLLPILLLALGVTAGAAPPRQGAKEVDDVLLPLKAATGEQAETTPEETNLLADARDGRLSRLSLAEAVLVADGVSDARRRKTCLDRFAALRTLARRAVASGRTPDQKADLLLRWLHANAMKQGYRSKQSSPAAVLETGTFNCVSATAVYTVLARSLDLDVRAVEVPGHAFAVLHVGERRVDVETTNARGFNPRGKRPSKRREVDELGLVATVYANRIADLGSAKKYRDGVRAGLLALRVDPACPLVRQNTTAVFVNWSASLARDGHPEQALLVTAAGLSVFPKEGKLRNNHHAALAMHVKARTEAGDYAGALAALERHGKAADPAQVRKHRASAYSDWARTLVEREEWREAIRILKAACEQFPKDRQFRATLKKCEERLAAVRN